MAAKILAKCTLDASYHGSTLEQELKTYGIDGTIYILVSGSLASPSEDFNLVVDLIEQEKAAASLEKRKANKRAHGRTPLS